MKLLTLLFGFYILLLPCIPCTDIDDQCANSLPISVSQTDSQQHQHESESCNPFCNCTCCSHIFTPNFQLNKMAVTKPLVKQKQPSVYKNNSLPSDFSGNIWQPPRFS